MTWKNGRCLATFTSGDVSASFDYDADGLRTTKTVGTSRVDYYRAGGLLLGEVHTDGDESYTINYMYDESGRMLGFRLDGAEYYYVRDYSGDVTGLINSRGELIGSYLYDPWGVLLETYLNTFEEETAEWTDADRAEYMRVLNLNPIRYKSYYYDTETGFYYLQSRYYDPITTRFINADGLISTGTGVLGYNMFAYCNNNPIMFADPSGNCPWTIEHIKNCCVGIENCPDFKHNAVDFYIMRKYDNNQDVLAVAQTIIGEAGGRYMYPDDWKQGQEAVAWTIIMRYRSGKFGKTYYDIVSAPNQFLGYYAILESNRQDIDQIGWDYAYVLAHYVVSGQHSRIQMPNGFTPNHVMFHAYSGSGENLSDSELLIAGNVFYTPYGW